ncbi:amidohydrolase family protein [Sphaerimonospora thailandensis]|uniref:Cytosine deaminase n=1 Tax=Sphaerimonospora thailandensis TaxID=795644 RepID=A0A8J3VZA3_9ACTN|nr:amidohydrolase family protein [Sphaerimonospora thailandensis]GIH69676.1 cytosine deaminase [Sphaerimonospora thailandensis]
MTALLDVTTGAGDRVDVRVAEGLITEVVPAGSLTTSPGEEAITLTGHLLWPAFAEPHAHLDKAYTAEAVANPTDDLSGAVRGWRRYRAGLSARDIEERAVRAALAGLARGTTAIRTHVGGPGVDFTALAGVAAARERLAGLVDIQIVAMGAPLSGPDAATGRADLERALAEGADVVGGVPHGESDPLEAMRYCLDLAAERGCPVDLHMDEHLRTDLDLLALAGLVMARRSTGVTASHCVSLAMQEAETQIRIAAAAAAAGISVVACPPTNLWLQGRGHPVATPRGLTAVAVLRGAGCLVAAGGDNVQDPFNPLGNGDPLDVALLLMLAGHADADTAVSAVSTTARRVLGFPPAGVEVGARADLVALPAASAREAIAERPAARVVFKDGVVVSRTSVKQIFPAGKGY